MAKQALPLPPPGPRKRKPCVATPGSFFSRVCLGHREMPLKISPKRKTPAPGPYLGLVAHRGHAAVVHEGEQPVCVVPGDELAGLTYRVHVGAAGGAGDLGRRGENPSECWGGALPSGRPIVPRGAWGSLGERSPHNRTQLRPTCNLPMATRQNLLPCPASGSSSGRETPGKEDSNSEPLQAKRLPQATVWGFPTPPVVVLTTADCRKGGGRRSQVAEALLDTAGLPGELPAGGQALM